MVPSTAYSARSATSDREFPSLSEYWDALQLDLGIVLADPLLSTARVCARVPGRPVVYGGTFAYTFRLETDQRAYALRCFHREFEALRLRYEAIQAHLRQIASPHFAMFQFEPSGITTESGDYPVVRMDWVEGRGLATYVASHLGDAAALQQLRLSLRRLAQHLIANGIAHGDIQPSNVIVQADGNLCLIDYDGLFVPALAPFTSVDRGQRNFQHPGRRVHHFDSSLDAFSFAVMDVALHALCLHPELWDVTASGQNAFLFRAPDIGDPVRSAIFQRLGQEAALAKSVHDLASICTATFEQIPSFEDFLAGRNIPDIGTAPPRPAGRAAYLPVSTVVDAADFSQCCKHVGERVELVGRVVHAVRCPTEQDRTACLNLEFDVRPRDMACVTIWSEALSDARVTAAQDWIGQWISVTGLVEPIARIGSDTQHRKHVSISVSEACQLRRLPEAEARYRLVAASEPGEHAIGQAGSVWTDPVDGADTVAAPIAPPAETRQRPVAPVVAPSRVSVRPAGAKWHWWVAAAIVLAAFGIYLLLPRGPDRPSLPASGEPVEVITPAAETEASLAPAPATPARPVLESQRALASADRQVDTLAGSLQVVAGEQGACLYLVRGDGEPVPSLCDDAIEFHHQATFTDRDVVVGFRQCNGDSAPCGFRRPFWIELRPGEPPMLREPSGLWMGSGKFAVSADDDGVRVDLGAWNGEHRSATLTAAGNLLVARERLPPELLSRADCTMVARTLEDCAASRRCGSFGDAARLIPAATWSSLQRLYHESTGFNADAYRKLCVRSCELRLMPSRPLVSQYTCQGAAADQWLAGDPVGGFER